MAAAATHWALAAAIQAGCFCAYVLPPGARLKDTLSTLIALPLLQGQTILVAVAIGWLAYGLAGLRGARWLIVPVHAALAALLLVDQLFYKISFDHPRPSMFEVGRSTKIGVAVSSLASEADALFYMAAAIAIVGEIVLIRALLADRPAPLRRWLAFAGLLLLAGIPRFTSTRYLHLNEHPLIAAGRDYFSGSLSATLARRRPVAAAPVPAPSAVDRDPRLAQILAAGRARSGRPNIVVVVIESVGARNLLNDAGFPSPQLAPNLARLAQSGVTFDSLYVPFPSTVRSLMNLHTGGRMLTQGGTYEVEHRYQGQLLGRAMHNLGYATGLFSSERLNVEACDTFLKQGDYDRFQDFEQDIANRDPNIVLDSWGAREEYTLRLMENWVDDVHAAGKPFYLEYMNVATHHPYVVPPGYRGPFAGNDDRSHYGNSVHYTDAAIGALLTMLAHEGVLDDTLIVVTGDHGEAFGDVHPGDVLHKNFLYEENVRSFVLLWDRQWKLAAPMTSSRLASNGDLLPTLLDYVGAPDTSLPGRSLLTEEFDGRRVFFLKTSLPEQWGLRDGKWKFIAEIRTGNAELYDLAADPLEHNNLAARETNRVAQYGALCEDWFVRSDAEYTARLENYRSRGGRTLRPEEYRQPGPKIQSVGMLDPAHGGAFAESATLQPSQRAVVWTRWVQYGEPHHTRWRWTSPSGTESWSDGDLSGEWETTFTPFPGKLPMQSGRWTVTHVDEGRDGLVSRFTVQ